jgi:hypothetical protein
MTVRLRPTALDDAPAICDLHRRNGLGEVQPEDWRACWETNPFASQFQNVPIGWLLETNDGRVVGSLGNVHMLYELRGRCLKAAIETAWAVDADFRNSSLQLQLAYFRQKGVDLWLNTSANLTASQVMSALKIPRIPALNYNVPLLWAVQHRNVARAALIRKRMPFANLLSYPLGIALIGRDVVSRSSRRMTASEVRRLGGFDERFDEFWRVLRSASTRLLGVRTREVLQWRFGGSLRAGRLAILVAERSGEIAGYALLVRRRDRELEMELIDVADLQAIGDDPQILRDLLLGTLQAARDEGVDAVKLLTATPAKRAAAEALHPFTYRWPHWQLYCRATPELGAALATPDAWDFSLFDTF